MPFLNWRERKIRQDITLDSERGTLAKASSDRGLTMTLEMSAEDFGALGDAIREIYTDGKKELRVDLPSNWIVFWKEREGESRLLLAHPKADEWVATVALTREHGVALADALGSGSSELQVRVGQLGQVASMSNVDIVLAKASSARGLIKSS